MSDDYRRIELITGTARRRHWSTEQKLQIIEESLEPGETVSSVARRRGVAPNLLYRWRRLMTEGGATAVGSDEPVVGSSEVRRLEDRIRDLERLLGRKTLERTCPRGVFSWAKQMSSIHRPRAPMEHMRSAGSERQSLG